jgi:hypothetical protein
MSGIDFVAYTNILVFLLSGSENIKQYEGNHFGISIITEIELLGWYKITKKQKQVIKGLMRELTIFPLNEMIKEATIHLKQNQKIKTPDAIIAATSQWLRIPLLTADKDFKHIEDLDAIVLDI